MSIYIYLYVPVDSPNRNHPKPRSGGTPSHLNHDARPWTTLSPAKTHQYLSASPTTNLVRPFTHTRWFKLDYKVNTHLSG